VGGLKNPTEFVWIKKTLIARKAGERQSYKLVAQLAQIKR
jgi:hypothetical protein